MALAIDKRSFENVAACSTKQKIAEGIEQKQECETQVRATGTRFQDVVMVGKDHGGQDRGDETGDGTKAELGAEVRTKRRGTSRA